jgi:hypothetical protein
MNTYIEKKDREKLVVTLYIQLRRKSSKKCKLNCINCDFSIKTND